MGARVALDRLQRWMQAVVVHKGSISEAVRGPAARREIKPEKLVDVVRPSRTMSPMERVGVYHGMYLLRMHDALASDYEGLRHFLGDEGFFELVRAYVQVHPSRSFSLNRLGDHLPDFVRVSGSMKHRAFCADLAELECAVAQVFDAPETPSLKEAMITSIPAQDWERSRLAPIAALRLVALRYPANRYLQTLRDDDHNHPPPRVRPEWVVVYRSDYAVRRLGLDRRAFTLLQDLSRGFTLGRAVSRARQPRRAPGEEDLFSWFRDWVSRGFFQSVVVGGSRRRRSDLRTRSVRN